MYTPLRNTGYNKAMPTINRRALCMHPREKPFRYRTVWRQLHRTRTRPSHKSNIVTGETLAERVWCTNFQSSLIFEYSLPSVCSSPCSVHFIPSRCKYLFTQLRWNLSDIWRSNFTIGVAPRTQPLSVTEIVPKSPLLYVNRSPICYSFLVDVRAIRNSVKKRLKTLSSLQWFIAVQSPWFTSETVKWQSEGGALYCWQVSGRIEQCYTLVAVFILPPQALLTLYRSTYPKGVA